MPTGTGRRGGRFLTVLLLVLLSLALPGAALAQEQSGTQVIEQSGSFPVSDPPEGPVQVYQSMLRFAPGTEAALHKHGGPGYITILEGELTLYEDGEEAIYQAGDSFIETPDHEYRGINNTDEEASLIVTYLVPEGGAITSQIDDPDAGDAIASGPEPLSETLQIFTEPPESFQLTQTYRTFGAGASSGTMSANGPILKTVVAGSLAATIDGESQEVGPGDILLVEPGSEYMLDNAGDEDATVVSTEFIPEAPSMMPDAGERVENAMAAWLIAMMASALMVIGGVLRFSAARTR